MVPPGQFRLRRAADAPSPPCGGNHTLAFDPFVLEFRDQLRVDAVDADHGPRIGYVLGHAFDVRTGLRVDSRSFDAFAQEDDQEAALETLLDNMFGTFVLLLNVGGKPRLYLDAGGTMSVVYDASIRAAGATAYAFLSPDEYEARLDRPLMEQLRVAHDGWFPSGLTAHRKLTRLLCNHYLDLETFEAVRHWPRRAPTRMEDAKAVLTRSVRANLDIVLTHFKPALALTAGRDSRTLLSFMRDRREAIDTFTIDAKQPGSDLDVYTSRRMAEDLGLRHRTLAFDAQDRDMQAEWLRRCGHAVGGSNAAVHTALRRLTDVNAIIGGNAGEVCRGFFWRPSDTEATPIDARMLVARFGLTPAAEVIEATRRWLERVPEGDAFFKLDLAYLELRVSAWVFAQSYVDPERVYFNPFISRRAMSAMFALPLDDKRKSDLFEEIIEENWKKVLDYPFNRYGDLRDWAVIVRKVFQYHRIVKKLRKLTAP